jgi:hypothetical protein
MVTQVPSTGTIYLSGTHSVTSVLGELVIPIGKTITLIPHNGTTADAGTATLQRASGHNGALINVNVGGTLNLRNTNTAGGTLIIDGGGACNYSSGNPAYTEDGDFTGIQTATSAAVVVYGTVEMYTGVTIQNNYNSAAWSAATGAGGGGGVSIFGGGTFTMSGGTIQQNRAELGGGVIINSANAGIASATSFTMTGGNIIRNLAATNMQGGGGVCSRTCTAELSGTASISLNSINTSNTSGTVASGWYSQTGTPTGSPFNTGLITGNVNLGTGANKQYSWAP